METWGSGQEDDGGEVEAEIDALRRRVPFIPWQKCIKNKKHVSSQKNLNLRKIRYPLILTCEPFGVASIIVFRSPICLCCDLFFISEVHTFLIIFFWMLNFFKKMLGSS